MDLKTYFERAAGIGVLATADAQGKVNAAVYARPHIINENTVAFIMANKHSYANVQSNPYAHYMFIESRKGYHGLRLSLSKTKESANTKLIAQLRRSSHGTCGTEDAGKKKSYLVYFQVKEQRPLVGD